VARAALATVPRETVAPAATLEELPLDLVDIGENIRVDPGELAELAASIEELGVLQPIRAIGPDAGGRYRAVWGQRRVMASIIAERETIPALVEAFAEANLPGARRSIEQLSENLQRKDLNPIEEAAALRVVLDADPELTQVALAAKLGRSPSWLANTLRLLNLDDEVQTHVRTGAVSASHAKVMVVLPAEQQRKLATRIVDDKISAHQIENEIRWKLDEVARLEAKAAKTEKWIPKAIAALEGTPTDVRIYVTGHMYDMDVDAVRKAIAAAGWKASSEYVPERPANGGCDCTAMILEVGGRKAELKPGCSETRHRDRGRNVDHQAERAREEATEAKVAELRARIRERLDSFELPILLLIAAHSYGDLPELIAGKGDEDREQLRDLAAERLAGKANARHAFGEYRARGDKALDDILAMLLPAEEAEASIDELATAGVDVATDSRGRLPRGTCSVCSADVALRKGGKVREHGRYGDDVGQPGVLVERVCSGSGLAAAS
jgi:ParB family chromosome partitioning protein